MSAPLFRAGDELFDVTASRMKCRACGYDLRRSTFGMIGHGRREVRLGRARETFGDLRVGFVLAKDVEDGTHFLGATS
ncbi:MAG: hypothetical protein M3167_06040 [Acidobacteriota bacterium]|nr:hypothetical protein [Acidobacteriota bacterium]